MKTEKLGITHLTTVTDEGSQMTRLIFPTECTKLSLKNLRESTNPHSSPTNQMPLNNKSKIRQRVNKHYMRHHLLQEKQIKKEDEEHLCTRAPNFKRVTQQNSSAMVQFPPLSTKINTF